MTIRSLMNIQYQVERKRPVLYAFGRESKDSGRLRTRIVGFKPHFWHADPEGIETDHFGRPITYAETQLPGDVREQRKNYAYTCEADVLFNLRFMITKKIYCGYSVSKDGIEPADDPGVPPLILHFDCEILCPHDIMPRADEAKYPVVAISTSNSYDNRVVVFVYGFEFEFDRELTIEFEGRDGRHKKHDLDVDLRCYPTEKSMLEAFVKYVIDMDPDVLTAWNGYFFDYPYIHNRCTQLGIDINRLSPFRRCEITTWGRRQEYRIKGRDALDLMVVYQRWRSNLPALPSYDFKYVVQLETGYEYTDYGDRIEELYMKDHDTLVRYCINDAFALKLLDETKEVVDSYDRKRRIAGCLISDALSNKKILDTYLLRIRDRPLPTATRHDAEGYKGAVVLSPQPGVHRDVMVFDLASIYPNGIVAYNISPETIFEYGSINITDPDTGEQFSFRRTPQGLLARAVKTFLDERERYRSLKKTFPVDSPEYGTIEKREKDYKWLSVSAYGVFGYINFRLFDERIARCITGLGRLFVGELVRSVQKLGYEVIYGDTDSIFVKSKTGSPAECHIIENHLNSVMIRLAKEHWAKYAPEIKYERTFTRLLMKRKIGTTKKGQIDPAKKRYAGVENGELYVRGLEPRRSDTSKVTRDTITKWLKMVLADDNLEGANKFLREVYHNLPDFPANDVGIPKGIQKATNNPWVRGRDYSASVFGYRFRADRKPILLYVKRTRGLPDTKELCITEEIIKIPPGVEIDWSIMREKTLQRKFEPLLEAVGMNWNEAVLGLKQTSLVKMFG